MRDILLYDSLKKEKTKFISIKEGIVKIYVCGPTVYDDSHLGHARSAVVFDLLHRVLKANGYKVIMAKNFTDIDDKIINRLEKESRSLTDLTSHYINKYKSEMKKLNVLDNTIEPKATENINEMIEMVHNLTRKGFTYETSDGIYMKTGKIDDKNNSSRIDINREKINQADFALWKFDAAGKFSFQSFIGAGIPGWHLECSAMIKKHLAYLNEPYQIDIHGGGKDLLFPHHENEAIQTKYDSEQELSKYWMHNGFVTVSGEKMSKSLGNSFFLKDVLEHYHGEVLRFYLLSSHYRVDIDFSETNLMASKKRLDRIYRLKKDLIDIVPAGPDAKFVDNMLEALNNDLNISEALVILDEMILSTERKDVLAGNLGFVSDLLGIGASNPEQYFKFGLKMVEKIEELIKQRSIEKANKNFSAADRIRDELNAMGINIMDSKDGKVEWEVI